MLKSARRISVPLSLLAALPVLFLAAAPCPAEILSAAAGCGADQVHIRTKHDKHAQPPQSDPAKAVVYFIEDDSDFNMVPPPTTRIGLDGQWIGATHDDSYFAFQIAPGIHHLCAAWQGAGDEGSALITGAYIGYASKSTALLLNAQPGGVYYFLDKNFYDAHDQSDTRAKVGLTLVDSAQAAPLLSKRPFTVPKTSTADKEFLGGLIKEKK
jgi:hypothetical protein